MVKDKEDHKKGSSEFSESVDEISVCDVMKKSTSKIIRKMESQVPALIQMYSDLYTEYLHSLDDVFGTCYIAEKQFFDRLQFDKKTLQDFDNYWDAFSQIVSTEIDLSANIQKTYVQSHSTWIKSFDEYVHYIMDNYAKNLSQINAALKIK